MLSTCPNLPRSCLNVSFTVIGDGGPVADVLLNLPFRVALDGSGNIYITNRNDHRIRQVAAGGTISTVAGGSVRDGGPAAVAEVVISAGRRQSQPGVTIAVE